MCKHSILLLSSNLGGDDCGQFSGFHSALLKSFQNTDSRKYFNGDFKGADIFMLVGGRIDALDEEALGPRKPRLGQDGWFTIRYYIPYKSWHGKPLTEVLAVYADAVGECLELMLGRALKNKYVSDELLLRADIESAIDNFKKSFPYYRKK
ncbi:MAG: hypothetical protein ABL901_21500 [Hyphomicrobiaceae bacterium]